MSLPPGFLDELRNRLSLAQVVGRKVMWDARKSNTAKGDFWAPCPFHQEKSASFHVDDRKGFYYCFGCHAKGDAIGFVQETENVGFMEAIEILAREAGLPMPQQDRQAQVKSDRRTKLAEVMEEAVKFYRLQLKTGVATQARAYLAKRGLSEAAQERWEIGFAPQGWQSLFDALAAKGIAEDLLIGAGLAKASDQGKRPYDVFRHRIMFPIRDGRGRAIAFGGRAMDPEDKAKYLNSPETELFDKGRNLFNLQRAREAAGKGQAFVVAEGYMDVIALSEAGFGGAVAPLGTAVTEDQLRMMWRVSDEPVIALDGDKAGIRAAMRVIDLALPLLEAGKSLRFALMPDGMDPDDLIRAKGAEAVAKVLSEAQPMVSLLWQREVEGKVFDSPERRAALDKVLREKIMLIKDPSLRRHYGDAIQELRQTLFGRRAEPTVFSPDGSRPFGRAGGRPRFIRGKSLPETATPSARSSELVRAEAFEEALREAVVLAMVIACPSVATLFEAELEHLECLSHENARLREAILRRIGSVDLRAAIAEEIGVAPLENLFAQRHVAIAPGVRRCTDVELVRTSIKEELSRLAALRGYRVELAEASEDIQTVDDDNDPLTWRVAQAALAVDPTTRREVEDTTEVVVADNGLIISKDERDEFRRVIEALKGKPSGS